ncbi:unnamed protein product [Diamesa serratosioi]
MKKDIEKHWKNKLGSNKFDATNAKDKFYVLSMFPYPSGNLHMGHVRVYSISDAMSRFYRLNGKNVFHPMGWDAFGLPAENAAIQRQIPAEDWTKQNITHMKDQLNNLGCSFDWNSELATCNPDYYKWTQKLFLMLYNDGLAYQKEATVNWDPVDKTVLADEQVDSHGCSWRSGAKVEKKLLRQWFIKTTKYAKNLLEGLSDPSLEDWKDITKLQKHWIGDCNGYNFDLRINKKTEKITLWTEHPEDFLRASFVAIKKEHLFNSDKIDNGLLNISIYNPFNGRNLPVIVSDEVTFPAFNETYIGVGTKNVEDAKIASKFNFDFIEFKEDDIETDRANVLALAKVMNIGGDFMVSSKLRDWLISRQRYWGTPIPIVHCEKCGSVPVEEKDLPIELPKSNGNIGQPLSQNEEWLKTKCPECGNPDAKRESDTMDTFVDSSWYYLRYLDAKNTKELVDKKLSLNMMPVDLYIGGKEHAVLHLYYARFMNHFLYEKGYLQHPEPFKRLLVQGMVMGRSYRKMSKSKFNGVDPVDVIGEHGCDTTRLIMLADVAPTSHRNWSEATFPGILNWQRRLWMTLFDFLELRNNIKEVSQSESFEEQETKLSDSYNFFTSGATFNYKYSHQLSVAISKMQGLTNSIRRAPQDVVALGKNYERALAAQIIMLAPMAPHFASELWSRFVAAPNRIAKDSDAINWNANVFEQKWPEVDQDYELELTFKASNYLVSSIKLKRSKLDNMTEEQALFIAINQPSVVSYLKDKKILGYTWTIYSGYEGIFNVLIEKNQEKAEKVAQQ